LIATKTVQLYRPLTIYLVVLSSLNRIRSPGKGKTKC